MRPLTESQLRSCGNTEAKRYGCACGEVLQEAGRITAAAPGSQLEILPESHAYRFSPKPKESGTDGGGLA
jgi:hypothetical protein